MKMKFVDAATRKRVLAFAVTCAVAALNAGCASTVSKEANQTMNQSELAAKTAMESIRSGKLAEPSVPVTSVLRVNSAWMPVSRVNEDDYRAAPMLNRNVVVNRHIADLTEAASYITLLTGTPVAVSIRPEAQATAATAATVPATQPMFQSGLPGQQQPAAASVRFISYNGKLSGLLDVLAARFDVYWEPDGGGIRFFNTKSRTFRLAALPGNSSMTSNIGTRSASSGGSSGAAGGAGGAGGGASSDASAQMNSGITFDGLSVWTAIEEGIKTMLSPRGRVVVTPATGTITVDDTPPSLEHIAKYVSDQNDALTRQVVLNVRVLSVELNDSDSYGVNWNAVYQNIGQGVNVALNSVSALPGTASSLVFNVVNTSSKWDGTQAMLEALSKQGRVSQVTSASIVTINNQPAPIQVGRQRSYLASSTTTLGTGGTGNTTTLVPGVVTTGFSMTVLPHILDNGRMMLQYAGDISSLVDIATVSSNGSSIQTPEIDTRNFLQRVMISNGETLVLTGFEQFGSTDNKQGVGSPNNLLLGGSARAANNKAVLVVLIQPVMTAGER